MAHLSNPSSPEFGGRESHNTVNISPLSSASGYTSEMKPQDSGHLKVDGLDMPDNDSLEMPDNDRHLYVVPEHDGTDQDRGHVWSKQDLLHSHTSELEDTEQSRRRIGPGRLARWSDAVQDSWAYEIFSMAFSTACLASMVGILSSMQNQPLSQWRLPIQPNALMAIFASIAKAALLYPVAECISQFKWLHMRQGTHEMLDLQRFDDASRGPWGSTLFLWRYRLGRSLRMVLAALCCLVTVLALAIDPFTQQIIDYPARLVPGNAGSAKTQAALGYDSGVSVMGAPGLASAQSIEPTMQIAMLLGIYGRVPDPPYQCSTGNCTYADVATLGFCSACQNVTAQSTWHVDTSFDPKKGAPSTNRCNITTPGGFNLTADSGRAGGASSWWIKLDSQARFSMGDNSALIDMALVTGSGSESTKAAEDGSTVMECQMRLCERIYSGFNVTNGSPNKPAVATRALNYTGNEQREANSSNSKTAVLFSSIPDSDRRNSSYWIMANDMRAITQTMVDLFTTTLYTESASMAFDSNVSDKAAGQLAKFNIARLLYDAPDISQLMASVAESMTVHVRGHNDTTAVAVRGQAFSLETYIRVSWAWFVLPAGLVVAAILLLQGAVLVNRGGRQGRLWKSSVLPYLYCPVQGVTLCHTGDEQFKLSQMTTGARNVKVRLASGGNDGALRLVSSP